VSTSPSGAGSASQGRAGSRTAAIAVELSHS
jgi:hypothetical protein